MVRALITLLACSLATASFADEVTCVSLVWEPYVGPSSPGQGWAAEVAQQAFAASGHELTIDFLPWSRALMATREGTYECILAIYANDARREWLHFSQPILASPVGFYARTEDHLSAASLEDLMDLRLGVVRDYVNVPLVDEDPRWKLDAASTDLLNLRKLSQGRVDLIFIDFGTARHLLERHPQPTPLQPILPPLGTKDLHVAFGRTPTGLTLHDDFDRALRELHTTGQIDDLYAQWGLSPTTDAR